MVCAHESRHLHPARLRPCCMLHRCPCQRSQVVSRQVLPADTEFTEQPRLDTGDHVLDDAVLGVVLYQVGQCFLGHLAGPRRIGHGLGMRLLHRHVAGLAHQVQLLHDLLVLVAAQHGLEAVVHPDFVHDQALHHVRRQVLQHGVGAVRARVVEAEHDVAVTQERHDVGR